MCPAPKQEIKSQEKPRYALKKRLTEEPWDLPQNQINYVKAALLREIEKSVADGLACVVPCVLILSAGIAKPHYEIFDSALRCRLSACGYLIK